jgi:uncharacterized membrane protein
MILVVLFSVLFRKSFMRGRRVVVTFCCFVCSILVGIAAQQYF